MKYERKVNVYELLPIDGKKSFYGKAHVTKNGNWLCLTSYTTHVASYNVKTGQFIRRWNGYSVTTMRHVNAFLAHLGLPYGGKAFWNTLPLSEPVKLG